MSSQDKTFLSRVFKEIVFAHNNHKRYVISQGGSSSTKTFSALQFLVRMADVANIKIDVVGQSVPHLRDGVLTDMPFVCQSLGLDFHNNFNKSEKIYKGSMGKINFISIDKLGKAHGGRRDILFLNEANYIAYPIVEQLLIRTRDFIIIDYNPTCEFWAQTKLMAEEKEDVHFIQSTYKDNERLEPAIIKAIENKIGNKNFWRVYGLGELGYAEGLVFTDWKVEDFDKESFAVYRHGVDWGFSSDPFTYNRYAIDSKRKKIYVCDEIHGLGWLNSKTAPMVSAMAGKDIVWCDCAEPKSIAEFKKLGINARGAKKGQGSIESGLKWLQEYEIIVHPTCIYTAKELGAYRYKEDKKGGFLPQVEDANNHHIDDMRYAFESDMGRVKTKILVSERFIY